MPYLAFIFFIALSLLAVLFLLALSRWWSPSAVERDITRSEIRLPGVMRLWPCAVRSRPTCGTITGAWAAATAFGAGIRVLSRIAGRFAADGGICGGRMFPAFGLCLFAGYC